MLCTEAHAHSRASCTPFASCSSCTSCRLRAQMKAYASRVPKPPVRKPPKQEVKPKTEAELDPGGITTPSRLPSSPPSCVRTALAHWVQAAQSRANPATDPRFRSVCRARWPHSVATGAAGARASGEEFSRHDAHASHTTAMVTITCTHGCQALSEGVDSIRREHLVVNV